MSLRGMLEKFRTQFPPTRHGHEPGPVDVSTMESGEIFEARPNFYYFEACGRPCYLPLYSQPSHAFGLPVTEGWPCEYYDAHSKGRGPHCVERNRPDGDWIQVVGQVRGQRLRSEHVLASGEHESSDIWDVVEVPVEKLRADAPALVESSAKYYALAYAPDIWLGNTGWHDIVYDPR